MLFFFKDLILPFTSYFHLNYLLFGMIPLVLEGDLPEEELALEIPLKNRNLINNYEIKINLRFF